MSSRRRAREIVLQLLYEADMNNLREEDAAIAFIKSRLQGRKGLTQFANELLQGTLANQAEIDTHLSRLADRWALSRMPVSDRNVLRLGAFEILFGETPDRVAVNEAIVLAKRYGSKDSPRFVNGVLDRLLKEKENPPVPEPDPETQLDVGDESQPNPIDENSLAKEADESTDQ